MGKASFNAQFYCVYHNFFMHLDMCCAGLDFVRQNEQKTVILESYLCILVFIAIVDRSCITQHNSWCCANCR